MPLFYTPKPRQFHYKPRFYDPEKERWEALKQKYADERALAEALAEAETAQPSDGQAEMPVSEDLQYFERRLREADSDKRKRTSGLTWKDLFRKREMPKFHYEPRFSNVAQKEGEQEGTGEHLAHFKKRTTGIQRRFDIADPNYMKPVPATRILLYTALVCALLYWILF